MIVEKPGLEGFFRHAVAGMIEIRGDQTIARVIAQPLFQSAAYRLMAGLLAAVDAQNGLDIGGHRLIMTPGQVAVAQSEVGDIGFRQTLETRSEEQTSELQSLMRI